MGWVTWRTGKQGVDVSRSRLISEAIKLLAQAVSEGKFELRG